jgi:hypothetical protein
MSPEMQKVPGRDTWLTALSMLMRTGSLVAVILGLGMMFGLLSGVVMLHILAGGLVLLSALLAAVRLVLLGRSQAKLLIIAFTGLLLSAMGMLRAWVPGAVHLVLMLLFVGLAEMGIAKARKAG